MFVDFRPDAAPRRSLPSSKLTGTLPASLADLVALTHLSLDHTSLTGPIPEALGSLTQLCTLLCVASAAASPSGSPHAPSRLNNNQMNGTIPAGLLDASHNGLATSDSYLSYNSSELADGASVGLQILCARIR